MVERNFTAALGRIGPIAAYDRTIRFWTREARWRPKLLRQVAPQAGQRILDVGCGTGSLALMLKVFAPDCAVTGLDPDPEALAIARNKALAAGVQVELVQGFAGQAHELCGTDYDKVVSTLLFHQVPMAEKTAGIRAMAAARAPGGEIHIADYVEQPGWLMRQAFRIVQGTDGYENTQPNLDGKLTLLLHANFAKVERTAVVRTPTGAITLFRAL